MERLVVSEIIYPSLLTPPPSLDFSDQFAFRPTGSTTAAIITLLDHITRMLVTNQYVMVIAIDFTKAFDTVRHATLVEKMAMLDIPAQAQNWLQDFLSHRSHCTDYHSERSTHLNINASIVQGSAVGPASYVVAASDLHAVTSGNEMCKYADDTYLIIPASNASSVSCEMENVATWSRANNLNVNLKKTTEIIFFDRRRHQCPQLPPETPGITRTTVIKILGVSITNSLSMSEHIQAVLGSSAQSLYAIKILKSHGLSSSALHHVYRSVVIARLLYAASAWWGFANPTDLQRINAFLRRGIKCGLSSPETHNFEELCKAADIKLFKTILTNNNHVLHKLLPPQCNAFNCYNLRKLTHNRQLPDRHNRLTNCNFLNRVLYNDVY